VDISDTAVFPLTLEADVSANEYPNHTDTELTNFFPNSTVKFALDENKICTRYFSLSVEKIGSGTVTGLLGITDTGIDCGSDCTEDYFVDTQVTLNAQAAIGYEFQAWGNACDSDGKVTLTEAKTCSATFVRLPPPGITVNGTPSIAEQSTTTGTYTLQLDSVPTGEVQITITPNAQCEVSLDDNSFGATQNLTSTDKTSRTVTVRAVDDSIPEGMHNCTISHEISGTVNDTDYPTTMSIATVTADITDNEPYVKITQSSGTSVTEDGDTDSFEVVLSTQPQTIVVENRWYDFLIQQAVADFTFSTHFPVTVTLNVGNQITLDKETLTFDDTKPWNTPQIVTVTAVDDSTYEGNHSGTISLSATSNDNDYNNGTFVVDGTIATNLSVSITDNDPAPAPAPKPTSTPSTTSSGPAISITPAGPIVQFTGDGSGSVNASDNSSSKFSCHSSETCPTKIPIGWYKFEPTADDDSKFVKWSGQNCNNGEYTTTFGGTCIAEFKLLPPPPQDPVDVTPTDPTTPVVTQPTPPDPTTPDVTQPTPPEPSTPVITKPVQPVEINYVGFSDQAYQATENAGSVDIIINRVGTAGEVSVDLLSSDNSGKADIHYRPIDKTLLWADGDNTEITVPVKIIDNSETDGDKNVTLSLGNADNAKLRLDTAVLTIVDDDEEKPQVVVKPEPTVPSPTVPVIIEEPAVIIPLTEEPVVIMVDESATVPATVNSGPSISVVACNTSTNLATRCDANVQTITYQEVGEHGNLTGGILDHPLTNEGLVSNTEITPDGSIKGGKVSGYTNNEGLIEDVEFVGASITGKNAEGEIVGTLGGKVVLASQIGGVVEDVRLAPDTQIVGSGTPKVGSEENIDRIGGIINGDSEKPATLAKLHIKAKSRVSNVIIAEDVTYGDGVTFTNVKFRTKVVHKVILKGKINGTRFKETYTRVESVTIRANSHLANLDIGDDVVFEDGVTLGENVSFSVHQRYLETHRLVALPNLNPLAAIDNQGRKISTWARLQSGARFGVDGERYKKKITLKRSKQKNVDILGNVLTDVRHIGLQADILVVAAYTPPGASSPSFYMLDNQGTPLLWDMDMSSLVPFRANITLAPVVPVPIWNNTLDIVGDVQVYFGYRLVESGNLVYSLDDVVGMTFTE